MTRDKILALAKANIDDGHGLAASPGELLRFAAAIRKAALLEAADKCEAKHVNRNWQFDTRHECAEAIRRMVKE